jgi:predicted ester cyclase
MEMIAEVSVTEQNKLIVKRFYEEVFNQGREEVLDEIISPDYVDYGHNPPGRGVEGAKEDFRGATAVFSDTHYVIDELIATEDRVIARWTGTYTHSGDFAGIKATGKKVSLTGISIYRLVKGKFVETRNAVNWLGLLQQLGAVQG